MSDFHSAALVNSARGLSPRWHWGAIIALVSMLFASNLLAQDAEAPADPVVCGGATACNGQIRLRPRPDSQDAEGGNLLLVTRTEAELGSPPLGGLPLRVELRRPQILGSIRQEAIALQLRVQRLDGPNGAPVGSSETVTLDALAASEASKEKTLRVQATGLGDGQAQGGDRHYRLSLVSSGIGAGAPPMEWRMPDGAFALASDADIALVTVLGSSQDGQCGPAHGAFLTSAPESGLCAFGTPSTVSGNGPWSWTCHGSGGTNAICSANIQTHAVTPSGGVGGSITPSTPQTVIHGASTQFAVTPDQGFGIQSVTGCGGSLNGSTYTTGTITAACTVIATFEQGAIGGQCGTADGGIFTTTPSSGLCAVGEASSVGGTGGTSDPWVWVCSGGGGAAQCNANIQTYTVSSSAGPGGAISPGSPQTVAHGQSASFIVTPGVGFAIHSVTGSCGGFLAGDLFTTNPIVSSCTVMANFSTAVLTHTVTPSAGAGGTISPNTPQTVAEGQTASFTLTPNPGFLIANVTGTCGGSLIGSTFTTQAITSSCSVMASFASGSVEGQCGAANGQTLTGAPSTGLCAAGIASAVSGDGPWSWTCAGIGGGSTTSCIANIQTYVVIPSSTTGGSISPDFPQIANHGDVLFFQVSSIIGAFHEGVEGTCGGSIFWGIYPNLVYMTNPIVADCTVEARYTIRVDVQLLYEDGVVVVSGGQELRGYFQLHNEGPGLANALRFEITSTPEQFQAIALAPVAIGDCPAGPPVSGSPDATLSLPALVEVTIPAGTCIGYQLAGVYESELPPRNIVTARLQLGPDTTEIEMSDNSVRDVNRVGTLFFDDFSGTREKFRVRGWVGCHSCAPFVDGIRLGMNGQIIDMPLDAHGFTEFEFPEGIASGTWYEVAILEQPDNHYCWSYSKYSKGNIQLADVESIDFECKFAP